MYSQQCIHCPVFQEFFPCRNVGFRYSRGLSPDFCGTLVSPVRIYFSPVAECSDAPVKHLLRCFFPVLPQCPREVSKVYYPSFGTDPHPEVGNDVISSAVLLPLGCQGGIPSWYLQFALVIRNAVVLKGSRNIIKIKHSTSWGRNRQWYFLFPRKCPKQ